MPDNNRTRRIEIRLTQDEYDRIASNASAFGNVSNYIRSAVKEFSNSDAVQRMQDKKLIIDYYQKYHSMLFHTSANINQALKRANELAQAGLLNASFIATEIVPQVSKTSDDIAFIRSTLHQLTSSLCKYD